MTLSSCTQNRNQVQVEPYQGNQSTVVVTPEVENIGDNLDLTALGKLANTCSNAQDLENKLNQIGSINNLDLDKDGNTDYIKVVEFVEGTTNGFKFIVDLSGGKSEEVARVKYVVDNNTQQVVMNVNGNQNYYGNNNYYTSSHLMTDLLIYHYLFHPHSYYYSPYHYGYYPSYYHRYHCEPRNVYRSRVTNVTHVTHVTNVTHVNNVTNKTNVTRVTSPSRPSYTSPRVNSSSSGRSSSRGRR